ncbi:hypothetical protein PVL29_005245 [Vitis rotundifolia]|uniref:Uncharacterized protein n=1 Tax=Vitis rotundifolia TaxID=103349 RepID=A0AA39E3M6_VITRO|nr:hypothetical protein PVL29_005245 [Vitis rotundifolia]
MDNFINNLPDMPNNILYIYDGERHYWIEFGFWELALKYPSIQKVIAILERHIERPQIEKNDGVLIINLEGKPIAHYYDPKFS